MAPANTAVLGMGMSATVFHIPFILALPQYFKLHTILERSATSEKSAARDRYGHTGVKVVTTLDEVLANPEVQVIVISTPNYTHYDFAKASLLAGKHVIIEKPLVPTSKEANELIDIASKGKLIIATYQNRRWDSDFLTLRRLLDVEKVFGEFLSDITEIQTSYDRFRPAPKGGWKDDDAWGGGVVFDLGSHLIDQILTLFGAPAQVYGRVWNSRQINGPKFADAFVAHFYYPTSPSLRPSNSLPITVTISSATLSLRQPQLRFLVRGTKASWVKYGLDVQEDQLKLTPPMDVNDAAFAVEPTSLEGTLTVLSDHGDMEEKKVPTEKGDYMSWFVNVGEAIQANDPTKLIVQPVQAALTIKMIELIHQSSEEGRVVTV
ncbi:putative NAD binding Rossmann fold oxidoreductase [Clavulina sp. PMI_390]|nr:putative NAD binding Rossmann fold oxidoreductase [Clavulina sp. PMI_390]